MRCPNCLNQHRPGSARILVCSCRYRFAFDPKRDNGMTDGKFLALIRRVSRDDTQYYTLNQLYAQFCRSLYKRPRNPLILAIGLAAGAIIADDQIGDRLGIILAVAALLSLGVALYRFVRPPPTLARLQSYTDKWAARGRTLDKLLQQPTLHTPPPQWDEADIYDYGVERLLLVERDLLVDLFVLNGFHAQERTLVLSQSGYPDYLLPVATRCLQENPQLPVYLLHDATSRGQWMASHLQNTELLPLQGHPILDLGIAPQDVKRWRGQRALQARRRHYTIPLDYVLFATLSGWVAYGMLENMAFADFLLPHQSGVVGADSGTSFDFG